MTTELTTTARHATQIMTTPANPAAGFGIEGFEGLQQSDLILPRWSLIQPTSKKDGADTHVGQFLRNIDGEFAPVLTAVILQVTPTRLLWSGDLADRRPECFSRDGVSGSLYGTCATCQFNISHNLDLRRQLNEGLTPKVCAYGYTYVLLDDLEAGTLALLGAMGTSVRPAKILNTQFIQRKRPSYSAIVRIESERQTNDKGKFFVLKMSISEWLDPIKTAEYRERYAEIRGATIKDVEDEDAGDAVDVPVDAAFAGEGARF